MRERLLRTAVWIGLLSGSASVFGAEVTVTVVDPAGEAVLDARVELVEARRKIFADGAGRVRFENVPPGSYHIEATSPSLGAVVRELTLEKGQRADVRLQMTRSVHQERIIVTAIAGGRGSSEVIVPVTVLDKTELEEKMQPTLGETLGQEPGVHSTFFGNGASRPVIRGQAGGRVRVLEGGLGVGDASTTSPDHAVATDPASADTIEIVRGPAALLYDTSAIGGLVNVLDNRVPDHAPRSGFGGSVGLRLGSAAEEKTGSVDLNGGTDRFAWHFDGARRDLGDYDLPDGGALENSDVESTTLTVGGSALFENGFLGASVRGFDTDYGIQELELEPMDAPPAPEEEGGVAISLEQRRIDLRGGFGFETGFVDHVSFGLGVTDYEHAEIEGGEVGTVFENENRELRVEIAHDQSTPLSGVIGLQVRDRDSNAIGEEAFLPENDGRTLALFALQEIARGPVRFELGGRFETTDVGVGTLTPEYQGRVVEAGCTLPTDTDFTNFSGSVGAVWLADETYAVGASLTRAVRSPTAEELYSCGPHLATQSFEVGNTNLDEEVGWALDLSLRKRTGVLTGEINLFTNRFDDYIYEEYTNVIRTEEGEEFDTFATTPAEAVLPEFRFTQADAEFYGAELRADVDLFSTEAHHVGLEVTADFVRAELRRGGEYLPRIPADRLGVGIHYRGDRWYGSTGVRFTDEQTRLAPSEIVTDPTTNGVEGLDLLGGPSDDYVLVRATVGYRLVRAGKLHDFSLRATNLTDETARLHTSRLKNVAPLPGADVSVAYRLVF